MTIIQQIKNINKLDLILIFSSIILLICIILLNINSNNKIIYSVFISIASICIVAVLFIKYKKSYTLSKKSEAIDVINKYVRDFSKDRNYDYVNENEDKQMAESNKRNNDKYNNSFWSGFNKDKIENAKIEKKILEDEIKRLKDKKEFNSKILNNAEIVPAPQKSYFMTNNTGISGLSIEKTIKNIENQINHAENKLKVINNTINTKYTGV